MITNSEKNTKFTMIPNAVARSPQISPCAKAIYLFIKSFSPSFPSYTYIIANSGIKSKTTVSKCMDELLRLKLIRVVHSKMRKSNNYEFPATNEALLISNLIENVDPCSTKIEPHNVHDMDSNKTNLNKPKNNIEMGPTVKAVEPSKREEIFGEASSSFGPGFKKGFRAKERPTFSI